MRAFYGSRISSNMSVTPEGYLICLNVPIARTGKQTYLRSELGLEEDPGGLIEVLRTEDEVFSKATIASFEGKPVTDDHPAMGVDASNITAYSCGHVQNVRRGAGDESDLIIADLFITSPGLIDKIRSGVREVSCGYDCDYAEQDGRMIQCGIRGNHVAVVSAGRAGARVAIKDSAVQRKTNERGTHMANKHSMFARIFSHAVKDMEPEEVADAIEELAVKKADGDEPAAQPAVLEPKQDTDPGMAELAQAVAALTEKVNALMAAKDAGCKDEEAAEQPAPAPAVEPKQDEDPLEKLQDEIIGSEAEQPAPTDEEAVTAPPEQMDEEPEVIGDEEGVTAPEGEKPENPIPGADSMAALKAIKAIRPIIAAMPKAQRKAAADRAAAEIRKAYGLSARPAANGYSAISNVIRQSAKTRAKDSKPAQDSGQVGKDIMKKFNPHYKNQ